MAEVHLDHPGDVHWFHGFAPAPVIGPCPHTTCKHFGQTVIAWGPDYERYELVKCDDTDGCNGTCRSWWSDHPPGETQPVRGNRQWLHVAVTHEVDIKAPPAPTEGNTP